MNILDCIFFALLLIFAVRGFARGFINEVFGIGTLIFSLFFAFCFCDALGAVFASSMNVTLAKVVAFFAIFVAAFIIIKLIQMLVKLIFSGPILKSLDKTLGLILGFLEGAALVVLVLFVMSELNGTIDSESLRNGSALSNFINGIPV